MFKRKQRRETPTTPPNFLDLRTPAVGTAKALGGPRILSDIHTPLAGDKLKLTKTLPARLGALTAVGAALVVVLAVTQGRPQNPFSATVLTQFKAQSYYPTYLPEGYALQSATATMTGGALTFVVSNGNKTRALFFSEQVKRPTFDLKSYYQNQIPDQTGFGTKYGDAVVGHFLNISALQKQHLGNTNAEPTAAVGSLNTTQTWVLVTAPKDFNLDVLKQIVLGLRR